MLNVRHENGTGVFKIHGRDTQSKLIGAIIVLAPVLVVIAIAWLLNSILSNGFLGYDTSSEVITPILVLFTFVIILVVIVAMSNLVATGLWARYELGIDCNTRKVTAYDRRRKKILWESHYDPAHLYLSQTRIHSRYSSFLYPALVYGHSHQDLVEYDIPSQRKTMLTFGRKQELETLMQKLGKNEPQRNTGG